MEDTKKEEQSSNPEVEEITNKLSETVIEDASPKNDEEIDFPAFVDSTATEIVFYDIETTIVDYEMIEFGAIVLDKKSLVEIETYNTLIFSNKITKRSIECNTITSDMVKDAPHFEDVADRIFELMNNRIWAGHNIITFDNKHMVKEFEKIGKTPPKPLGVIDTLPLLRNTFGKRAGNMKMASLGNYFKLGEEKHRALEDSRMTVDVFKNCCTIWFLEQQVGRLPIKKKESTKSAKKSQPSTPAADSNDNTTDKVNNSANPTTPLSSSKTKSKPKTPKNPKTPTTSNGTSTPTKDSNNNKDPSTPVSASTPTGKVIVIAPEIKKQIDEAMASSKTIWISYDGGSVPKVPRNILPQFWKGTNFSAICKPSDKQATFSANKILEIRDEEWKIATSTAVTAPVAASAPASDEKKNADQ